jgi:Asp-tRNA(Asn)/Glu-tRNA(Gln) amidotransferase A subunit family amidase
MAAVAAIRNRDCSVAELTEGFLARIGEHNPRINALRDSDADQARQTARALDARLDRGEDIGPLGGLPVVVKENCDTAGYACSAGLSFRTDHRPAQDSWVTARLRKAGAVILGTSISDPGAFGVRTAEVTHPIDAALTVGGSSGGSAAALAAGLCLGAIGTDTGGSIRIPSACCGTVGLKPSFGVLPMTGIFPLVPSLDHAGPMARTVGDTALLWSAIDVRRTDAQRPVSRVGVDPTWVADADAPIRDAFVAMLDRLTRAGVKVHEITLPGIDENGGAKFVHGSGGVGPLRSA